MSLYGNILGLGHVMGSIKNRKGNRIMAKEMMTKILKIETAAPKYEGQGCLTMIACARDSRRDE